MHTCTVPIEIIELEDNSFHLLVHATLDGIEGDFIIDTGASVTVADRALFPGVQETETAFNIHSGSISGDISDVRLVDIRRFDLGEYPSDLTRIALIDLTYVNEMYVKYAKRKILGLLGGDFCVKYQAVIDCERKTFTFRTHLSF